MLMIQENMSKVMDQLELQNTRMEALAIEEAESRQRAEIFVMWHGFTSGSK
jgi:hypothetical protein